MCWDDWSKLLPQRGNLKDCDKLGVYKHGSSTLNNFKSWVQAQSQPLKAFKWSDTLALSASQYMTQLDGCKQYEPEIYLTGWTHKYINELATFDDHARYVFYPEQISWSSPKITVYDWLVDDVNTHHLA